MKSGPTQINQEVFISYVYHGMMNDSEFNKTLKEHYRTHSKPKYIPSATDGGEIWLQFFTSIDFSDFINAAIAGGILYDVVKWSASSIFSGLIKGFKKLVAENVDNAIPDFQKIQIEFNNMTVTIFGLNSDYEKVLSSVIKLIVQAYPLLEKRDIGEVCEIIVPVVLKDNPNPGERKFRMIEEGEDIPSNSHQKYWKVSTGQGVDWYIYDVVNDVIVDSVYLNYVDKKSSD